VISNVHIAIRRNTFRACYAIIYEAPPAKNQYFSGIARIDFYGRIFENMMSHLTLPGERCILCSVEKACPV
jgi:hypothetical protein